MATLPQPTQPQPSRWEEIDPFVEAFEHAHARDGHADLADFLPEPGHTHYPAVLRELVRADIEYTWRGGGRRRTEDYLAAFPALRTDPAGLRAVAFEEYRQRQLAGDHPLPVEYQQRLGVETIDWPLPPPEASDADTRPNGCVATAGNGAADVASAPAAPLFVDPRGSDEDTVDRPARAAAAFPEPGSEFRGFNLVKEIGCGAFARVYLAHQSDLAGRPVALKLSTDLVDESRSLAQLQHTNIVPIYSVHRAGSVQALCMPYLGSTTLADVLAALRDRSAALPEAGSSRTAPAVKTSPPASRLLALQGNSYVREVLRIVARLADGLAYAHDRGILHQDLKPANVLLADDGTPMLLDFNLAQDTKVRGSLPAAHIGGTLPYMAPEQLEGFCEGRSHPDPRSDLYALGLILYELLALQLPFPMPQGSLEDRVVRMVADRRLGAPDVRRKNKDVTPAVAAIVRRCLETDPARRYPSARLLAEDIERHLADLPLRHASEPSLGERSRKWLRRHPRLASSYVVVVAVALVVIVGGMYAAKARRLAIADAAETRRLLTADLIRARFLLGVPIPGEDELADGTAAVRRALAPYGVLDGATWDATPAFVALSHDERERLRADVRELLLLLGRGVRLQATAADRAARLAEARRLNELAEACASSKEALRGVWLQRTLLLDEEGRNDEARDLFKRAEGLPPHTARDYFYSANEQMVRGDYGAARELLQSALRLDPREPYVHFALGLCHAQGGNYHKAANSLDVSLTLWPDFYISHYHRARVHNELGEHAEAALEFSEAIRLRPTFVHAYVDRALAYLALGHYNNAEADLTHALEAGTRSTRVYFIRARVRQMAGNIPGAEADRVEGLRREPCDEVSWVARGLARMHADPNGALADFDRALQVNPHYLPALEDRAAVLAERLGRPDDAVEALAQVIHLAPQRGQARAGRAVLLARLGRRDEALHDAKEAERLDPRPEVLYQTAGVYALTSEVDSADRREAFRLLGTALRKGYGFDLLEIDPDLRPIRGQPEFRRLLEAARALRSPGEVRSR